MNRDVHPPKWAHLDDDYREKRRAPARSYSGSIGPSEDAVRQPPRMQFPMSRSTSSTPGSRGGSTSHTYSRDDWHQKIPSARISEVEEDDDYEDDEYDDDEYEDEDDNCLVASDVSYFIEVYIEWTSYYERYSPDSYRRAPPKAAAAQPSRPKQKGLKKPFHKVLGKGTCAIQAEHVAQPHPLTLSTARAAERVQRARQTGNRELEDIMRARSEMRRIQDWQDEVVAKLIRM